MATVDLVINAKTKDAEKALIGFGKSATKSISALESSVSLLKNSFVGIGSALAGGLALREITRQLAGFSDAVTEITTIADASVGSVDSLSKSLISTAATFGKAPTEQAKAFYQIISAGITDATQANEALIAANKLAIGGLAGTGEAIDIITTALNVYKGSNLQAAEAADVLFTAVKLGKTSVADLAGSLGGVLPVANTLGISFADTAATIATLTAKGIPTTAEAVTGLKALFNSLILAQKKLTNETDQVQDAFSLAALETKGLTQFLKDANDAVDGNTERLLELLGSSEALIAFLALAGDGFESLGSAIEQSAKSAGAADAAYQKVNSAVGRQLEILSNNFKTLFLRLSIEFGAGLSSVLTSVNIALQGIIGAAPQLISSFKSLLVIVGELAAGYVALKLAVIAYGIAESANTFIRAASGAKDLFIELGRIAASYGRVAAAQLAVVGQAALITAGFLAIGVAIDFLIRNFDQLGKIGQRALDVVQAERLELQLKRLKKEQADIANGYQKIGGSGRLVDLVLKKSGEERATALEENRKQIEAVEKQLQGLYEQANTQGDLNVKSVVNDVENLLKGLTESFSGATKDAANALSDAANAAAGAVKDIKAAGTSGLVDLEKGVKSAGAFIYSFFAENIKKAVEDGFSSAVGIVKTIGDGLAGVFSSGEGAAKNLAGNIVGAAAEGLGAALGLPGLGQALTPLFQSLTAGPEAAKEQVRIFAEMLPDFVVNIVEALIEALPELVNRLVDVLITEGGLVRIADALVRVIPRVGVALAESLIRAAYIIIQESILELSRLKFIDLRDAFSGFFERLNAWLGEFINSFLMAIGQMPVQLANAFITFINDLRGTFNEFIRKFNPTGGGDIGIRGGGPSDLGDALGLPFAAGGVVPAGFPSDSFPASLTSGELVVPPDTTGNLFNLIDSMAAGGGGSRENGVIMAALAEILGTLRQPMTVETTATVNGDAFADIMLRLNRLNARTAA